MFEDLLRLTNQTVSTLAAAVRKWLKDPMLSSVTMTATIPVGATTVVEAHGLGRAMNGAIIIGQSAPYAVCCLINNGPRFVTLQSATVVATNPLVVQLKVF